MVPGLSTPLRPERCEQKGKETETNTATPSPSSAERLTLQAWAEEKDPIV